MAILNDKSYLTESGYKDTNLSFSGCDMIATANISIGLTGDSYFVTLGSIQTISYSIHMEKVPVRSLGNVNAKDYVYGQRTIAGSLIFAVFNRHVFYELFEKIRDRYPKYLQNKNVIMDEIPPFDITISYANEYGIRANMALYGIRIINEGQTMSINDIYTENTYQFVATDIEYLNSNEKTGMIEKGIEISRASQLQSIAPREIGYDDKKEKKYNLKVIRDYDIGKDEVLYKIEVSIENYDNNLNNSLAFRIGNEISNQRKITQAKNNVFIIPKEYEPKKNGISEVLVLEGEEIVHFRNISFILPIENSNNYIKYELCQESYSDIVVIDKKLSHISIYVNNSEEKTNIAYVNDIDNNTAEVGIKKIMDIEMPDISDAPYSEEKGFQFFIDSSAKEKVYVNDITNFDEIVKRIEESIEDDDGSYINLLKGFTDSVRDKSRATNIFEKAVSIYRNHENTELPKQKFHILQSFQKEINNSLIIDDKNYIEELSHKEIVVKKNIGKIIIKNMDNKLKIEKTLINEDIKSDNKKFILSLRIDSKYLLELKDHFNNVVQFAYLYVPSEELMKESKILNYALSDKISSFRGGGFKFSNLSNSDGEITIYFPIEKPQEEIENIYIEHNGDLFIESNEEIEVKYMTMKIINIRRIKKEAYIIKTNNSVGPINIYLKAGGGVDV